LLESGSIAAGKTDEVTRSLALDGILEGIRQRAQTEREKGTAFERLCQAWLRNDPRYHFSNVYLWNEWPQNTGADLGIDLVAEGQDGITAIQCKFFASDYEVKKLDIDSFFTASGKAPFTHRLIVTTTNHWSANARAALDGQHLPSNLVTLDDLQNAPLDWSNWLKSGSVTAAPKYDSKPHQREAIADVLAGFEHSDRGKLIMACGTGKTFTALRLAETLAQDSGASLPYRVLFCVPSISLLNQTYSEWSAQARLSLHATAVCSDVTVGKKRSTDDLTDIRAADLPFPASTNAAQLVAQLAKPIGDLAVVFSTYQSLDVLSQAQRAGLPDFDLIVCDEAHRTTGASLSEADESAFVRIHQQTFVKGARRLYMTATPRVYTEAARVKAGGRDVTLVSMDDTTFFGPEFHRLGFDKSVRNGLLTDYKILVFAISESQIAREFQEQMAHDAMRRGQNFDDIVPETAKIIACANALLKKPMESKDAGLLADDPKPMRRAVAFTANIAKSKDMTARFAPAANMAIPDAPLAFEVSHVDGTMPALERSGKLAWLRESSDDCRILSNARCLTEGIDIPALDAVVFMAPRNSTVDIIQAVGRVMRNAANKNYGYIILPVTIPAGHDASATLDKNENFRTVWGVLQALRSHDERLDAQINALDLDTANKKLKSVGMFGGKAAESIRENIAWSGNLFDELFLDKFYTKVVERCGSRIYFPRWADDIAEITERHVASLVAIRDHNSQVRTAFDAALENLQSTINSSITPDDLIAMLAQHLVTKPVFEVIVADGFTSKNAVATTFDALIATFAEFGLTNEVDKLRDFYDSIRQRAEAATTDEARQSLLVTLYDNFFQKALPKKASSLGIVYTPIEVVDFILNSVEWALRSHFDRGLTDQNVQILDPFAGTGSFLVRLIHSGLIAKNDLKRKYGATGASLELHANEILLLAYYIATINIERAYALATGDNTPFDGTVLTDTFNLNESDGALPHAFFVENSKRASRQKSAPITVIVGNPPYSVGQESANDENRNIKYPKLDNAIRDTYKSAGSGGGGNQSLYDSYWRALRWASDRIGSEGVIAFITNGGFLDSRSGDGLRKCLASDFTHLYIINLRGDARKQGEDRRKTGDGIFDQGSRAPIAIIILVKSSAAQHSNVLHYAETADYATRQDKLSLLREAGGINGLAFKTIIPDQYNDWLEQRRGDFSNHLALTPLKTEFSIFTSSSGGLQTNRDAWVYNSSEVALGDNSSRMIRFYEQERKKGSTPSTPRDPKKISWSLALERYLKKGAKILFDADHVRVASYRPFNLQYVYFDQHLNSQRNRLPTYLPTENCLNFIIALSGTGERAYFSTLVTRELPDLHIFDVGTVCYPRYVYTPQDEGGLQLTSIDNSVIVDGYIRHDAISDAALSLFHTHYDDTTITKDSIFAYVYGVLHDREYRRIYANTLKKERPRIPLALDFWSYANTGQALIDLHLAYESAEPYPLVETWATGSDEPKHLQVKGMRYGRTADKKADKTVIVYNDYLSLSGIPERAHEYVISGRSALDWILERYRVSIDSPSEIMNDANLWGEEHHKPTYILDLIKSIVTVSLRTLDLVDSLSGLGLKE
jgi:predicted helicase